jgi:hypothetical protein
MEGFNTVSKPNLIEPHIIMQLDMNKAVQQMGGEEVSLGTKVKTDMMSFLCNNFWVLLVIGILGYILRQRYIWYQTVHLKKEKARMLKEQRERQREKERQREQLIKLRMKEKQKEKKKVVREPEYGTYDGTVYASY